MTKGFSIAALVIAIIAIFVPLYSVRVSWIALIIATIAALAGERIFSTATALIAALNVFMLSPATFEVLQEPDNRPFLILTIVLLIAPFVGMILNASEVVKFNKAQKS